MATTSGEPTKSAASNSGARVIRAIGERRPLRPKALKPLNLNRLTSFRVLVTHGEPRRVRYKISACRKTQRLWGLSRWSRAVRYKRTSPPPPANCYFADGTSWAASARKQRETLTPHLAMIRKHLLRPERLRRIPPSFSWVDHRLVRDHYLRRADHSAWALYLFLLTVADVQGLSFYSDRAIGRHLKMDCLQLSAARQQLVQADLIAYQKPLYQVLALHEDPKVASPTLPRSGQTQSVADILRRVVEGGQP